MTAAPSPPGGRRGRDRRHRTTAQRQPNAPEPPPRPPRPAPLTAAMTFLLLEALLALGFAGYLVVEALTVPTGESPTIGWGTAVLALVFGIGMLAIARGLRRSRGWSRAPAIVTQILLLTIGIPLVQGGSAQLIVGVPLTIAAAVTLVLLLTPSTGDALDR